MRKITNDLKNSGSGEVTQTDVQEQDEPERGEGILKVKQQDLKDFLQTFLYLKMTQMEEENTTPEDTSQTPPPEEERIAKLLLNQMSKLPTKTMVRHLVKQLRSKRTLTEVLLNQLKRLHLMTRQRENQHKKMNLCLT